MNMNGSANVKKRMAHKILTHRARIRLPPVQLRPRLPVDDYTLYFDNFLTSLNLLQHVGNMKFRATGTVRANQIENCPVMPVDQMKKKSRGTFDYRLDSATGIVFTQ
jgi:hypothetical protein